jgi:cysteinyl-tRNA synthetase
LLDQCEQVLGDPPSVSDVAAQGVSGREVRYWLLSVHYRKPLTYSLSRLEDARRALQRLDRCVRSDADPRWQALPGGGPAQL